MAEQQEEKYPVGALTSLPREEWAAAREEMMKNNKNRQSLFAIESSITCLCLDKPLPSQQRMKTFFFDENRFYDKPIQWIYTENGLSGYNI